MDKKYIVDCSYYSTCFDGAIFDGPFRLYFAQYQEKSALELYHHLSTTFISYSKEFKQLYKLKKRYVNFFMYPTLDEKKMKQPKGDVEKIFITPFLHHYIIGFNMESISHQVQTIEPYLGFVCKNWIQGENQLINDSLNEEYLLHLS